jgi:hypothetical protein
VDPQTGETPILRAGDDVETVRALLAHGADMNHPGRDGLPAVVNYVIPGRHWEAALYLVQKGADLDMRSPHGVSLDYYMDGWSKGDYGDVPEGYLKLRDAIAERRKTNPAKP